MTKLHKVQRVLLVAVFAMFAVSLIHGIALAVGGGPPPNPNNPGSHLTSLLIDDWHPAVKLLGVIIVIIILA